MQKSGTTLLLCKDSWIGDGGDIMEVNGDEEKCGEQKKKRRNLSLQRGPVFPAGDR